MLNESNYRLNYLPKYTYMCLFLKYRIFFNSIFYFNKLIPLWLTKIVINNYLIEFQVTNKSIIKFLFLLKNHTLFQFKSLVDIIVIDVPKNPNRFTIIYNLLSTSYNVRFNVVLFIKQLTPLFSIVSLYSSANWLERECWDMFGVFFFNHPDLRRILTDYGFKGHPLRKDFPLTGFREVYYDDILKSITKIPVSLAQEFRNYYFRRTWRK